MENALTDNVIVRNLPAHFGEADLTQFFARYGPVASATVHSSAERTSSVAAKHALNTTTTGIVRFFSPQSAAAAVGALNGQTLPSGGRPLVVQLASSALSQTSGLTQFPVQQQQQQPLQAPASSSLMLQPATSSNNYPQTTTSYQQQQQVQQQQVQMAPQRLGGAGSAFRQANGVHTHLHHVHHHHHLHDEQQQPTLNGYSSQVQQQQQPPQLTTAAMAQHLLINNNNTARQQQIQSFQQQQQPFMQASAQIPLGRRQHSAGGLNFNSVGGGGGSGSNVLSLLQNAAVLNNGTVSPSPSLLQQQQQQLQQLGAAGISSSAPNAVFNVPTVPAVGLFVPQPVGVPPPEEQTNLHIFHLHPLVDDLFLMQTFAHYGAIASVKVIKDYVTGEAKGYGFVQFYKRKDAQDALKALNGVEVGGKRWRVSFHNKPGGPKTSTGTASSTGMPGGAEIQQPASPAMAGGVTPPSSDSTHDPMAIASGQQPTPSSPSLSSAPTMKPSTASAPSSLDPSAAPSSSVSPVPPLSSSTTTN